MSASEQRSNRLKETAILVSGIAISQLPFQSIYSYADTLFDKKSLRVGDPQIAREVAFLKKTTLADIEFTQFTDETFVIRNTNTGEEISVSNRPIVRGEMRGAVLRDLLKSERNSNPNQTLYDVITNAVKSLEHSDAVIELKSGLAGEVAEATFEAKMSKQHFQLFINALLQVIQDKIDKGEIDKDSEPEDIRNQQDEIWQGIDLNDIYDTTAVLAKYDVPLQFVNSHITTGLAKNIVELDQELEKLGKKATKFERAGHTEAHLAITTLRDKFAHHITELLSNKTTPQQFKNDCINVIDQAAKGPLKDQRGWSGMFSTLSRIVSIIASWFGKQTDSVKKLHQMKDRFFTLEKETTSRNEKGKDKEEEQESDPAIPSPK